MGRATIPSMYMDAGTTGIDSFYFKVTLPIQRRGHPEQVFLETVVRTEFDIDQITDDIKRYHNLLMNLKLGFWTIVTEESIKAEAV